MKIYNTRFEMGRLFEELKKLLPNAIILLVDHHIDYMMSIVIKRKEGIKYKHFPLKNIQLSITTSHPVFEIYEKEHDFYFKFEDYLFQDSDSILDLIKSNYHCLFIKAN